MTIYLHKPDRTTSPRTTMSVWDVGRQVSPTSLIDQLTSGLIINRLFFFFFLLSGPPSFFLSSFLCVYSGSPLFLPYVPLLFSTRGESQHTLHTWLTSDFLGSLRPAAFFFSFLIWKKKGAVSFPGVVFFSKRQPRGLCLGNFKNWKKITWKIRREGLWR